MHKRGQLAEGALHYLIITVCIAVILGVGYYSFSSVQNQTDNIKKYINKYTF